MTGHEVNIAGGGGLSNCWKTIIQTSLPDLNFCKLHYNSVCVSVFMSIYVFAYRQTDPQYACVSEGMQSGSDLPFTDNKGEESRADQWCQIRCVPDKNRQRLRPGGSLLVLGATTLLLRERERDRRVSDMEWHWTPEPLVWPLSSWNLASGNCLGQVWVPSGILSTAWPNPSLGSARYIQPLLDDNGSWIE